MSLSKSIMDLFKKHGVDLKLSEEEKVKLAEAPLADGTIIYTDADTWEAGVNIFILNEEGEQIPVPVGEYPLEDGNVVIVAEDGIVEYVGEPMEVAPELSETITKEQAMAIVKEAVDVLEANLSKQIQGKEDEIKELKEKLSASEKEVKKVKEEFSHKGLPKAVTPVKGATREELAKMTSKQRINELFNKLK